MRFSSIINTSIGNLLEWYDFGLFAIFATLFSRLFFPDQEPYVARITLFSLFAVGFFCRPLGAFIFGYLGDKYGRAQTLRLSILMIAIPTMLIGFLPTYNDIGIYAPLLLVLIRIWQGISIGGEFSGSLIYLAESAPTNYRATVTSLAGMGANLGILLASLVGVLCSLYFTETELNTWAWRVPYLLSAILCILIYVTRLRITETPVFEYLKKEKLLSANPIKTLFTQNISSLLLSIGLVCMGSTFYYFCFIYIPIFLTQEMHFSIYNVSITLSALIGCMVVAIPIAGWLCDHLGRRKMLLFNAFVISLITLPGFYLLQERAFPGVVLILFMFMLASSLEQGTTPVALVENFPTPARYTGLSLGYNIGNGFLGGTVPVIAEWLAKKTQLAFAPAFYIVFCAIITGLVVFFFVQETRGKNLL